MNSWLPWRFLIGRIARRRGFIDPFAILARMRQFSQPSEVQEPIELIRAGVVFHARGLVNTKVLQHNLDWVWPYWISRQFDPGDPSFLPRAFSFTHVNLTHRNWTALGLPGMAVYPIVDPRGLVTPGEAGWSLDWWFVPDEGRPLYPSQCDIAGQKLRLENGPEIETRTSASGVELLTRAWVEPADSGAELYLTAEAASRTPGWLVLAVRPANPEGVSFIDEIRATDEGPCVNGSSPLRFEPAPDRWAHSNYARGDVATRLDTAAGEPPASVVCKAGLATMAAMFRVAAGAPRSAAVHWRLPIMPAELTGKLEAPAAPETVPIGAWDHALTGVPRLEVPVPRWKFLHEAALHTLTLLSPGEIYPGPYTYRRFWFRDACLIMHALLTSNLAPRAWRALNRFPERQKSDGYFHSQEGEWDANGQVLWIADRFERLTGDRVSENLLQSLRRAAAWIGRKRAKIRGDRHTGLLPPGFSAEHLGPNDYYYWDDFWGVAGQKAAAAILARHGDLDASARFARDAETFTRDLAASFAALPPEVAAHGYPASPYRRMDSGAIGSMVGDYPLHLDEFGPGRFLDTADWLARHCLHRGGFFQDMIHSGVNAYLSLALAQTFLRAGDSRWLGLVEAVAAAASPTGQWPEGIHPITGGGCMGDGQHAWAAAEWILMMRALFVREEDDHLVIGAGLPQAWFTQSNELRYGPTATAWGKMTVIVRPVEDTWRCFVEGDWFGAPPRLKIAIPGFAVQECEGDGVERVLEPEQSPASSASER